MFLSLKTYMLGKLPNGVGHKNENSKNRLLKYLIALWKTVIVCSFEDGIIL